MQLNAMLGVPANSVESSPLLFRNIGPEMSGSPLTPKRSIEAEPAADLSMAVEAAREVGRREAEAVLLPEFERRVSVERASVASALDAFLYEKKRYFAGLEKEVVRLALAIAERVLHRESSMDPTLLAGAARVALEQVDQESSAVLSVCPQDAANWGQALASIGRDVQLREDMSLERGQCMLQTEAGSFELGLKEQLCEIERGFFEILGRTPVVAA